MSKVPYLDFQAIKRSYSIDEIMSMTGLPFRKDGKSYRCECPVHGGGKRGLVVSPNERDEKGDVGVFYCFGEKAGGDRVALLTHVRASKPYAVFKELAERRPAVPDLEPSPAPIKVPEEKEKEGGVERGFKPLPYLTFDDPAVLALGIPPEVAEATGLGFAPRGLHRGRVAIPLRLADGAIVGYISIEANTSVQLPPRWSL